MAITLAQPRGLLQWRRIRRLYRSAFPAYERKPLYVIRRMYREGKTDVWYCRQDGAFAGFATTINGAELILVDYLAVANGCRGKGIGSALLQALQMQYVGKGLFLEIESTFVEADNREERLRRKRFYLRNGLEELQVEAELFGTRMELLGRNCQLDFAAYRAFYHDNYSLWAAEHVKEIDTKA